MSTVECRDLSAGYNGRTVVESFRLSVGAGEWVGIIGPNGAGKSTLLRVIAGVQPASGSVRIGGAIVGSLSRREMARLVAVVPQSPLIPPAMSVLDYVLLGRNPHIRYWGSESKHDVALVRSVLVDLDLAGFEGRMMASLSGGERQRAVLGRALAQQAKVLLLDEPTAALDLGHQQQVLELVDRLRRERGLTVISALHDLTLAGLYAERLVVLVAGRIMAEGDSYAVLTPQHIEAFFDADVAVLQHGDGRLVIAPRRSSAEERLIDQKTDSEGEEPPDAGDDEILET